MSSLTSHPWLNGMMQFMHTHVRSRGAFLEGASQPVILQRARDGSAVRGIVAATPTGNLIVAALLKEFWSYLEHSLPGTSVHRVLCARGRHAILVTRRGDVVVFNRYTLMHVEVARCADSGSSDGCLGAFASADVAVVACNDDHPVLIRCDVADESTGPPVTLSSPSGPRRCALAAICDYGVAWITAGSQTVHVGVSVDLGPGHEMVHELQLTNTKELPTRLKTGDYLDSLESVGGVLVGASKRGRLWQATSRFIEVTPVHSQVKVFNVTKVHNTLLATCRVRGIDEFVARLEPPTAIACPVSRSPPKKRRRLHSGSKGNRNRVGRRG